MKEKLSGYLQVLMEQNPKSIGGQLPDDGFYFRGQSENDIIDKADKVKYNENQPDISEYFCERMKA